MTQYDYTPFVLPLALSAAFCIAMLLLAWRNRAEPVAPWFAATLVALLVWTVGYMVELMAVGLGAKIFWANLEYVATIALPLVWLQVVLIYTRRRGLSRTWWIVLSLIGAAVLVCVFLNPGRLFRVAPHVAVHGSLSALHPDYGPIWSFGWIPFTYGLLLVSTFLLVKQMRHAHRIHVRQSVALLIATILPLAAGTVYAIGLSPWPDYNPAMALISISGVLMAYALFSSRVFDLAPLARDAVVEHLADGVLVLDMRGRLMDFNPAAARTFPELDKASVGLPVAQLFAARPAVLCVFEEAAQEAREADRPEDAPPQAWEVEVGGLAGVADASRRTPHVLNLLVTPISSGGGAPFGLAVVAQDVTQRVELLEDALQLATTDGLTGVLTRRRFNELAELEVARAIRHGLQVTLLLLDIDRLKLVNDTHGHAAGDAVLSSVAAACQSALRAGELIGRLGGDEFGVLLPLTGADEASRVAERLRRAAGACLPPEAAATWCSTVSIGVATAASQVGDSFGGLMDAADQALYVAKEGGRDRIAVASAESDSLADDGALPLALLSGSDRAEPWIRDDPSR